MLRRVGAGTTNPALLRRLTQGLAAIFLASLYFIGMNHYLTARNMQVQFIETRQNRQSSSKSVVSDPDLLDMLARKSFQKSFGNIKTISRQRNSKPLVLLYTQYYDFKMWPGFDHCPAKCEVTNDKRRITEADMVIFQGWKRCDLNSDSLTGVQCQGWDTPNEIWNWPARNIANQTWMYMSLESQQNTASGERLKFADNLFNYTMTYKEGSSIYYPYGEVKHEINPDEDHHRFDANTKSKLLLWLVSHCNVKLRDDYARQLEKHVQLDEFGKCSGNSDGCARGDRQCDTDLKQQYKFYLSFENSICSGYITEKFWEALYSGMVPVVLGASKEEYLRIAPPHSFIHIDDFLSPSHLAEYLKRLDKHDDEYNKYHEWRQHLSIEKTWMKQACELCRIAAEKPHSILKISNWWNMKTQCQNITEPDLIMEIAQTLNNPVYL